MKIDWKKIGIKELASIVSDKLNENGIDAILVGGACVSIYSENKYLSSDLYFVSSTSIKEISPVLLKLGFKRKSSRHFEKNDCPLFIEFVSPPAALGREPVTETNVLKTRFGNIRLLTPTDSVKDRLAAYYHWNDHQALEQHAQFNCRLTCQRLSWRKRLLRFSQKRDRKFRTFTQGERNIDLRCLRPQSIDVMPVAVIHSSRFRIGQTIKSK